eukprot:4327624-Prymnesium_polylepis.1
MPWTPARNEWVPWSEAEWRARLRRRFGSGAAQVEAAYPLAAYDHSTIAAFVQMDSDQCVACPTWRLAARVAARGTAVYTYEFDCAFIGVRHRRLHRLGGLPAAKQYDRVVGVTQR